jgi:hypothetical protein
MLILTTLTCWGQYVFKTSTLDSDSLLRAIAYFSGTLSCNVRLLVYVSFYCTIFAARQVLILRAVPPLCLQFHVSEIFYI